jgi:hypothetical protein
MPSIKQRQAMSTSTSLSSNSAEQSHPLQRSWLFVYIERGMREKIDELQTGTAKAAILDGHMHNVEHVGSRGPCSIVAMFGPVELLVQLLKTQQCRHVSSI